MPPTTRRRKVVKPSVSPFAVNAERMALAMWQAMRRPSLVCCAQPEDPAGHLRDNPSSLGIPADLLNLSQDPERQLRNIYAQLQRIRGESSNAVSRRNTLLARAAGIREQITTNLYRIENEFYALQERRPAPRIVTLLSDERVLPKTMFTGAIRNLAAYLGPSRFGINPRRLFFWVDIPSFSHPLPLGESPLSPNPVITLPPYRVFFSFYPFPLANTFRGTRTGHCPDTGIVRMLPYLTCVPLATVHTYMGPNSSQFVYSSDGVTRWTASSEEPTDAILPGLKDGTHGTCHPHVKSGNICLGDAVLPMEHSLTRFDYCTAADLLTAVLSNYNPGSPYRPLRYFAPLSAIGVHPRTTSHCECCSTDLSAAFPGFPNPETNGRVCSSCLVDSARYLRCRSCNHPFPPDSGILDPETGVYSRATPEHPDRKAYIRVLTRSSTGTPIATTTSDWAYCLPCLLTGLCPDLGVSGARLVRTSSIYARSSELTYRTVAEVRQELQAPRTTPPVTPTPF